MRTVKATRSRVGLFGDNSFEPTPGRLWKSLSTAQFQVVEVSGPEAGRSADWQYHIPGTG